MARRGHKTGSGARRGGAGRKAGRHEAARPQAARRARRHLKPDAQLDAAVQKFAGAESRHANAEAARARRAARQAAKTAAKPAAGAASPKAARHAAGLLNAKPRLPIGEVLGERSRQRRPGLQGLLASLRGRLALGACGLMLLVAVVGVVAAFTREPLPEPVSPFDAGVAKAVGDVEELAVGSVDSWAPAVWNVGKAVHDIQAKGHDVGYYLCTVDGTPLASYHADHSFYAASAIKGPYLLAAMADPATKAPGGLEQTAEMAIVNSDNESYYQVKVVFGVDNINRWLEESGAEERLNPGAGSYVDLTPKALALLWTHAYDYLKEDKDPKLEEWIDRIYAEPLNSSFSKLGAAKTWSKPGWIDVDDTSATVNAGVIERDGKAYVLAVMTDDGEDFPAVDPLIAALDALAQKMA